MLLALVFAFASLPAAVFGASEANASPSLLSQLESGNRHQQLSALRAMSAVIAKNTQPGDAAAVIADRFGAAVIALLGGSAGSAVQVEASKLLVEMGSTGAKAVEALIRVGAISSFTEALKQAVQLPWGFLGTALIMLLHLVVLVADDNGLPWADELLEADGLPSFVQLLDHKHKEVKRGATTIIRHFQFAPKETAEVSPWQYCYTLFESGLLTKLSPLLLSADDEMRQYAADIIGMTLVGLADTVREVPESQPAILENIIDADVLPNALTASMQEGRNTNDWSTFMAAYRGGCALLMRKGNDTEQSYTVDHSCIDSFCKLLKDRVEQRPDWGRFENDLLNDELMESFAAILSGSLRQRAKTAILPTTGCRKGIEAFLEHPTDVIRTSAKEAVESINSAGGDEPDAADPLAEYYSSIDEAEDEAARVKAMTSVLLKGLEGSDPHMQLLVLKAADMIVSNSEDPDFTSTVIADRFGAAIIPLLGATAEPMVLLEALKLLLKLAKAGVNTVEALIGVGAIPSLVAIVKESLELPDDNNRTAGVFIPLFHTMFVAAEAKLPWADELIDAGGVPLLVQLLDYDYVNITRSAAQTLQNVAVASLLDKSCQSCQAAAPALFSDKQMIAKLSSLLLSSDSHLPIHAANIMLVILKTMNFIPNGVWPEAQSALLGSLVDAGTLAITEEAFRSKKDGPSSSYVTVLALTCALLLRKGNDRQRIAAIDHGCLDIACGGLGADHLEFLMLESFNIILNDTSVTLSQRAKDDITCRGGCVKAIQRFTKHPDQAVSTEATQAVKALELHATAGMDRLEIVTS
ncbi:unnamed protein product [Vitrella brassicaformis CCMP3155]|uniref:UNC-45/Cro1/She4 central domain-containing protein n=1 Tax=Vitrella brassicaformis (strain CCMP3155) TaxID=1169540 RepID=A0A0G4GV50_VITBC|nr:unnamed protein product [Vitrella brassicaformis CCMP3155]|eukprot:CEM34774.1 unnamed protein product [Vitrella brassicaformis CCMP3155]